VKTWRKGKPGTQAKKTNILQKKISLSIRQNLVRRWKEAYDVSIFSKKNGKWKELKTESLAGCMAMKKSEYVLQEDERTLCACGEKMSLLAHDSNEPDENPEFYICWKCRRVNQVGAREIITPD